MDKVSRLKFLHNLINDQGVQTVVSTSTSAFSPTPLETIILVSFPSPTHVIDVYASSLEVDQLMEVAAI